jgi:GTPase Era involved in 16S rRNA processing
LITSQAEGILEEINEGSPDILLVDTPGQMELFAFRSTGIIFANQIGGIRRALVNLMDANLCRTPYGLLTSLMLSLNVQMRFFYPQLNIVSKSDLIENEQLEELQDWIEDSYKFEEAINTQVIGERREMAVKMSQLVEEMHMLSETFPVSAKTNSNIDTLYGKLQFIWQGGEDFQVDDRVIR